jgi:hypothetical protein
LELYCFDTSAFIEPWVRHYPISAFPSLWAKLIELIDEEIIIAPEDVLGELKRKDDTLYKWAKSNSKMFYAMDEELQNTLREIINKYPKMIDTRSDKSPADPVVVSLAKVTNRILVTYEKDGSDNRPKIPFVCKDQKIECIGLMGLIVKQGWVF